MQSKKFIKILFAVFIILMMNSCSKPTTHSSNEAITDKYFIAIQHKPLALQIFINQMPKGGDLHSHLSGAVYAEDIIKFAANDGFCVDPNTLNISKLKNCPEQYQLKNLKNNYDLYNKLVNYWSYRLFARETPEQRLNFFDSFLRDVNAVNPHRGEILANILQRNAEENVSYVELLILPETDKVLQLSSQVPVNYDFKQAREYLLAHGAPAIVNQMQQQIASWIETKNKLLHCDTSQKKPGCNVTVRFQVITLRALPASMVYSQLVLGFMLAQQDPNVVAVNIVGPEDAPLTLQNYKTQMQMFAYLHTLYPRVKISLHAGELTEGLVPPEDLLFHIKDAVYVAGANRIGHGVDIAYEQNAQQTLNYMAQHNIAVEVCLTSNELLLNIAGKQHPISLYLKNHIPVTLNTDDEGVFRTDLNQEYLRAAIDYKFSYLTLKQFARNALTYNFMPGASLWQNAYGVIVVSECANDKLGAQNISSNCANFLRENPKANLQWQLERQFNIFEAQIAERAKP